ncbi:uncharacterized protein ALTATR162_LOCUS11601 [Alternaria atra]|uniref:Uncharacterized protein n=1 Tax=Alternaria atra TaxID=119953 RepID=A0A8J2NBL8_9PLEO|nr:uncharacterized protein ALTATR162_LOCUS11601 [Alternaria atra]CAG5186503.1 unnamed protein product [Alternaria atra]
MSQRQSLEHKRHHHFGRHRSGSYLSRRASSSSSTTADTPSFINGQPRIFQGTDAVPQNRKVTLQRVIDTHHALELKHGNSAQTPTSTSSDYRPTSSSSSMSSDPFTIDFSDMSFPDAEVRAFRYLLRKWDPSTCTPDPAFDLAVTTQQRDSKEKFEESAIKHFFSRVALWDASAEEKQASGMTRSIFFFRNRRSRRRRSRAKSDVGRMLGVAEEEDGSKKEDEGLEALKEVTTREGLAQLLWTLVHSDESEGMVRLREECMGALREMYQVTVTGVEEA